MFAGITVLNMMVKLEQDSMRLYFIYENSIIDATEDFQNVHCIHQAIDAVGILARSSSQPVTHRLQLLSSILRYSTAPYKRDKGAGSTLPELLDDSAEIIESTCDCNTVEPVSPCGTRWEEPNNGAGRGLGSLGSIGAGPAGRGGAGAIVTGADTGAIVRGVDAGAVVIGVELKMFAVSMQLEVVTGAVKRVLSDEEMRATNFGIVGVGSEFSGDFRFHATYYNDYFPNEFILFSRTKYRRPAKLR
ncbi:hypothetical protein EV361DRAFT_867437 [Lentinula raphanica]|nr:hypothetical protein EV361DRAFT_867437 [Lentinula raphanica]